MNTFIEITKSEHGHGGEGWDFGTCLWSPARNRAGNDRYSIMRTPEPGDRVIHFYETQHHERLDTYIIGESSVRRKVREVGVEPPSPGKWAGMAPYYRIDLVNYRQYESPLPVRQGQARSSRGKAESVFREFATSRDGGCLPKFE